MSGPNSQPQHPSLPGGFLVGSPFGIALKLHWSFLLLVGWLAFAVLGQTGSVGAVLGLLGLVGLLFACVALHEYGHALTARRYGIGTLEITLLPIGGVAQLERSPSDPRAEMWIALAGPAVNFALAAVAAVGLAVTGGATESQLVGGLFTGSLLVLALQINLVMGIFNLIPALPMDGGRVLRAMLAQRMPNLRATQIATTVAQGLAAAMMIFGLLEARLMLAIIGGFVWITARAELRRVQLETALRERAEQLARAGFDPRSFWSAPQDDGEWVQGDGPPPPNGARTDREPE